MLNEDSSYRTKKEGNIFFVYRGKAHIGNIIAPTLGGDKTKATKFTAIAKHWGGKKTHDSKNAAMDWLKNKHGSTMSIRMKEENMSSLQEEYSETTHEYTNDRGHKAHLVKTIFSNGDTEFHSHLPKEHKTIGSRTVRHSSQEKAHARLTGLGYKHTGEVTRESEDILIGQTPETKTNKSVKRSYVKLVKKDAVKDDSKSSGDNVTDDKVMETFCQVWKEAKEKKNKDIKIAKGDVLKFDPEIKDVDPARDGGNNEYDKKKPVA